jgi:hypothetical protein
MYNLPERCNLELDFDHFFVPLEKLSTSARKIEAAYIVELGPLP